MIERPRACVSDDAQEFLLLAGTCRL